MDKYEYNVKSDQIKKLYSRKEFEAAAKIADEIDWYRNKDNTMLNRVADVYENTKQYEKAKEILLIAYERSPLGRQLAYKLTILALRTNNFVEADEFYQDFVEMSPADVSQYLLKYRIAKAKGEDIDVLISILEAYVDVEMDERWQYELAKLYHQAGKDDKCIDMCEELILWFNEGKYVEKAKELKKLITGIMSEYQKISGQSNSTTSSDSVRSDSTSNETGNSLYENDSQAVGTGYNSSEAEPEFSADYHETVQPIEGAADVLAAGTDGYSSRPDAEDDVTEADDDEINREFYSDVRKDEEFYENAEDTDEDSEADSDEEDIDEEDIDEEDIDEDSVDEDSEEEHYEDTDENSEKQGDSEDNSDVEDEESIFRKNVENGKASSQEIMAYEAVKAAEEAAKEAQKAADFARRLVEEAKMKARQIVTPDKAKAGKSAQEQHFKGMTAEQISKTLEEEEELSGNADLDKKDSMIEIFEFDKNKEGKGAHIGEELTKTAEIDIDEINLKIAEQDNIYNTANIQAALAKSMEKLMSEEKKTARNVFDLDINRNEVVLTENSSIRSDEEKQEKQEKPKVAENVSQAAQSTEQPEVQPTVKAEVQSMEKPEAETTKKSEAQVTKKAEVQSTKESESQEIEKPEADGASQKEEPSVTQEAAKPITQDVLTEKQEEIQEEKQEDIPAKSQENIAAEKLEDIPVQGQEVAVESQEQSVAQEMDEKVPNSTNVKELEETVIKEVTLGKVNEIKDTPLKEMSELSEHKISDTQETEGLSEEQDFEPTKRIDSEEINRILNETNTLYRNAQKEDQVGLEEPMPIEEQIEGQMTIEEVLAEYEKRRKAEQDAKERRLKDEAAKEQEANELAAKEQEDKEQQNEDQTGEAQQEEVDEQVDLVQALAENGELDDEAEDDKDAKETNNDDNTHDQKQNNTTDDKTDAAGFVNHKIPEEYKSLFKDFSGSSVHEADIADCLDQLVNQFVQDGTSRVNNVIITGSAKVGKTTLGLSVIKAANRGRNRSGRKVAKVKASALNKRGVTMAMMQILGTDLIIEQAGNLMPITIVDLMTAMKNYTEEMLIVLEDDKVAIDRMLENMPELRTFFTNRLDIKEMEIDDMAKIAKDYALEQKYEIDDMGMLALYAKIDDVSGKKPGTTEEDICEIVDEAIKHANRLRIGKLFGKLRRKSDEMSTLTEEDFL